MPFPMQLQNLGWEQDLGDATSDVAKMGAGAYQMYSANQPMVDAIWKMMDPKGHEKHSKEVFGTINQIDQMGTAMGGWNMMNNMGESLAGRPNSNTLSNSNKPKLNGLQLMRPANGSCGLQQTNTGTLGTNSTMTQLPKCTMMLKTTPSPLSKLLLEPNKLLCSKICKSVS